MVKYQVEKGVPIPIAKGGGANEQSGAPLLFPFDQMDIGDSFAVPNHTFHTDQNGRDRTQACVLTAARQWGQRAGRQAKFTTRRLDGEVRCWRVT